MYLLIWGTFLTICSQLVSPLVNFLLNLTCTITDYEVKLREDIRDLRKELSKISMQDQFAVYAKTERKINKLTEKLQNCTNARSVQYSKVRISDISYKSFSIATKTNSNKGMIKFFISICSKDFRLELIKMGIICSVSSQLKLHKYHCSRLAGPTH